MGTRAENGFAPIAVFAYNRPDRIAGLMKSLQNCEGFSDSDVTVFIDGPKRSDDRAKVDAVRAHVQGLGLPNVCVRNHDVNRGLRRSIFAGVSEIVQSRERVIVLEDDLVLSPAALRYFNMGLDRYAETNRVWSVVGYAYDAPQLRFSPQTVALPFAHPWGWATWSRAWQQFDLDSRPTAETLDSQTFRSSFDLGGLYPFTAQLRNSALGRVDSWFIHWYYTVFQHGGVSIFPPRRLVDNYGLSHGAHGSSLNPHERIVKRPALLEAVPQFCDPDIVDYSALDALRSCWELRVQRFVARAGSAKRAVKSRCGAKHG